MDKKLECPPLKVLDDLIQGKMVESDVSEYSSHLEECSACQEQAMTVSPYYALVEPLRHETPAADKLARDVPPPLIECLKQIPRRVSSAVLPADTPAQDRGVAPREQ